MSLNIGASLPRVGSTALIVDDDRPHEMYARHVGKEVLIIAHDRGVDGSPLAVYRVRCWDNDYYEEYFEYHALVAYCFKEIC